jgi:hypothetical protein
MDSEKIKSLSISPIADPMATEKLNAKLLQLTTKCKILA